MTSALLGMQEHWDQRGFQRGIQQGIQQERQRFQSEKMQLLNNLLNAGVDENILSGSFSDEEIRLAKASRG